MNRSGISRARRVVVKVGTSVLTPEGEVRTRRFTEIARSVSALMGEGRQIVLVSSGAIGLGVRRLQWDARPESIPDKQAAASVGQIDLCRRYERAFERHGHRVGQILLTHAGLADRQRFLNARHTLQALLRGNVIPLINENDSVATEELRFGDNDQLAAQVVNLAGADLLILLTDVDGLRDGAPRERGSRRVPEIQEVTPSLLERVLPDEGPLGSGGMRSKLEAARTAARSGVPTVIADGRRTRVLERTLAGEDIGTLVRPGSQTLSARKHWIAYALRPRGTIQLDAGAVRALRERGRSLLPIGIVGVEGRFGVGDLVRCLSESSEEVARGLSAYSSGELDVIKGHRTSRITEILGYSNGDAVIHRDDLIVL
jgi:glutamate 5-kinase